LFLFVLHGLSENIVSVYLFVAGGKTLNLFPHSGMTPRLLKDKKTCCQER